MHFSKLTTGLLRLPSVPPMETGEPKKVAQKSTEVIEMIVPTNNVRSLTLELPEASRA
jgi:hypothetical protein